MDSTKQPALTVTLHAHGVKAQKVPIESLEEASRVVSQFQDEQGLGASDCGKAHGNVATKGVVTHRVSYNGRIGPVES